MRTSRKISLAILVIIGFYAIFLLFSDIEKISNKLINFKIEFLPIIFLLVPIAWILVYLRWYFLLKNLDISVPHKENFTIFLASGVLGITPGRIGELLRSQFLKEKFGISRTKTVPLIFVEKLYDLTGAIIISFVGIWLFPEAGYIITVGFVLLIFVFVMISSRKIFNKTSQVFMRFRITRQFVEPISESAEIIKSSTRGKIAFFSIILSVGYWFIISLAVYLIFLALEVDSLSFLTIISTYVASLILGVLSFLPAGIGVTEGSLVGLLSLQGIEISTAVVIALLVRLFTLWYGVVVGLLLLKISGVFSLK